MNFAKRHLATLLFWTTLGGLGGVAVGCVITTGTVACNVCDDSPLCHNHVDSTDGLCHCDDGYTWEAPNDANNLQCNHIPAKGGGSSGCPDPNSHQTGSQCLCDAGYEWCNPSDNSDLSCCSSSGKNGSGTGTGGGSNSTTVASGGSISVGTGGTGGSGGTGGTGTATGGGTGATPDPSQCTANTEGYFFCSNDNANDVTGSRLWQCTNGMWQEGLGPGDQFCMSDGYDFAYGCYDDGTQVQYVCGTGPGTPCTSADDTCVDSNIIHYCNYGKLTEEDCNNNCVNVGDSNGVTYDFGECISSPQVTCLCCDNPVNNHCPQ